MQNAYKFKNRVSDPDILLSPDTLLSPTKGSTLSRAHGRPTISLLRARRTYNYSVRESLPTHSVRELIFTYSAYEFILTAHENLELWHTRALTV